MQTSWLVIKGVLKRTNLILVELQTAMSNTDLSYQKVKNDVDAAQQAVEALIDSEQQSLEEVSSLIQYQELVQKLQVLDFPITEEEERFADEIIEKYK